MITQPKYSIIIPIRHSAEYLPYNLIPLIESNRQDFEVIIVVNDLITTSSEVLLSLKLDRRFKLIQNEVELQMSLNYERAISYATGEWILLLGADDSILNWFFSVADNFISRFPSNRVFRWRRAYYFWNNVSDIYGQRVFEICGTSKVRKKRSISRLYKTILGMGTMFDMPQIYTCSLVHREVILELKSRGDGNLYHSIIPDIYTSVLMTLHEKYFVDIDFPLTIVGTSGKSMSRNSRIYQEHQITPELHSRLSLHPSISEKIHSMEVESIYLAECLRQIPFRSSFHIKLIINLRVAFDLLFQKKAENLEFSQILKTSALQNKEIFFLPLAVFVFQSCGVFGSILNRVLYRTKSRQKVSHKSFFYTTNERTRFVNINDAAEYVEEEYSKIVRSWIR